MHEPSALPPAVASARARLAEVLASGGAAEGPNGASALAIALGEACREAQLPGVTVYRLLTATVGLPAQRPTTAQRVVLPTDPRESLLLLAIDAYFGV